jgi:surface protein
MSQLMMMGAGTHVSAVNDDFVFTVQTTGASETFTILGYDNSYTYNATINWGDGGGDSTITSWNDADLAHTYATADTYTVTISGTFPAMRFNSGGDVAKLRSITNLGDVGWRSFRDFVKGGSGITSVAFGDFDASGVDDGQGFQDMFSGCSGITSITGTSGFINNQTGVTDASLMFNGTTSLTGTLDVANWNVSTLNNFQAMFFNCKATTIDVSSWTPTAATTFEEFMENCTAGTVDTSGWTSMASATNMFKMFKGCTATTLDVDGMDTSAATNMGQMFRNTTATIDPQNFDVTAVTGTGLSGFLQGTSTTTAIYDQILIKWEGQAVNNGLSPNFGTSTYTGGGTAATARANLIADHSWVITDGGTA